ncbi:MAG TPA: hypothetical protein DCM08_13745 [Microscillaceae bacterium]|jgi:Uma2 family endonuclease|nr:hypothetical protein [Microscillaceae bacterium]
MATPILDLNRLYSYADYLQWQFEESLELIRGQVFWMSPAPKRQHQDIARELSSIFSQYLKNKPCKVYFAPFDVRLPAQAADNSKADQITTVVQPDICVVCDPAKLDDRGCLGAPDLIIEIVSPSTAAKDTGIKFELYESAGVAEYWIVYPVGTIHVYWLDEKGKYYQAGIYSKLHHLEVKTLPGLTIELAQVFVDDPSTF